MPKSSWDLAVIRTGGKQYLLTPEGELTVEKLSPGAKVEVLLTSHGETVSIGKPTLSEDLPIDIIETGKASKVVILKFKPKKRVLRKTGHRQQLSRIRAA